MTTSTLLSSKVSDIDFFKLLSVMDLSDTDFSDGISSLPEKTYVCHCYSVQAM